MSVGCNITVASQCLSTGYFSLMYTTVQESVFSSDLDNRFMCSGSHIRMLAVTILLLGNIDVPNK